MPSAFIYLGILLAVVIVWFVVLKRPVYEAVFIAFIILVAVTNTWTSIDDYILKGLSDKLIYSMVAFIAMSTILTKTKILDSCTAIILALLGRIPGGAGYVSVIASAFMGALSGSGPGNVMATGAITIPAMKRSGFPPELAANVESNSSYMGNMIPPSGNILAAIVAYEACYGDGSMPQGRFWVILWGVALWFILQRLLMVFIFCKYYKVKPIPKEELPSLKQTLKEGWQGLLLPLIIIVPFLIDFIFNNADVPYVGTFFADRLGNDGAKFFSSATLLFIPALAAIFTALITKDKKKVTPAGIAKMFAGSAKSIAPAVAVCIFGYMIGAIFNTPEIKAELATFFQTLGFNKIGMVLFSCIFTCILGMVIPGSALVVSFGHIFIPMLVSVGVDPLLAAAMLPCICGVMCGITPPLGLGMYAGMSLAESDFSKTVKNNLWWVFAQFALQVLALMGWLPIIGLL